MLLHAQRKFPGWFPGRRTGTSQQEGLCRVRAPSRPAASAAPSWGYSGEAGGAGFCLSKTEMAAPPPRARCEVRRIEALFSHACPATSGKRGFQATTRRPSPRGRPPKAPFCLSHGSVSGF